jgi:hypothetical protein
MKLFRQVLVVGFLLSMWSGLAKAEVVLDAVDQKQIDYLYGVHAGSKWGEAGHHYTTFIVARLAKIKLKRSYDLCWGSQVPDDNVWFSAVWAAGPTIFGSSYHRRLMTTLHSLHGGDKAAVLRRQKDLQGLISRVNSDESLPAWQIGMMIHAFGDSFAHVQDDGQAYGYPLGHTLDGEGPDTIAKQKDHYRQFVKALYASLTGKEEAGELKPLFDVVETLSTSADDSRDKMIEYARSLGFTDKADEEAEVEWLEKITRSEVETTMAIMDTSFAN